MANKKEPMEELLKDLGSTDIKRRLRAVDGLVARGGKQAERELVRLLSDSSWHLRSYVAKVLGGFGKYMIGSILSEAKQGVWYVRATACTTLGYIGEIECLDPLLSYLEDESARVRIAAEEALLAIISRDRLKFVETYLSRKDADFQEFILEKLKKIDSDLYKDILDESA
jgi:HEAT repeat protein